MEDERNRTVEMNILREYIEFIDDANDDGSYIEKIKEMIRKSSQRLVVSVNDLRQRHPVRCARLLSNGFYELPIAMKAVREVVASIDSEYAKLHDEFYIGFEGSFGAKHVTPRSLTSRFLGNTVCVEGIVTKCSTIRPKIVRSVHYCPATKKSMERKYNDMDSFDVMPSVNVYPTKDDDGNLLETEYGLSKFRDHQTLTVQEMPERAPTGQLPRSVDIFLDNDLVDMCKPGDRILVVGVYRCLPGKWKGYTNGVFRTVLVANHITLMSKNANMHITVDDVKECKKFSMSANPFDILAKSLAPTICGHEYIKKAVLCLLLGGLEKILENGTRLRGDINVLLVGDPSVAKSQCLRYVANVAPRVVMTTGRSSSGVGLTAAVTTDIVTGDRKIEAGAMVLADRGIVCIDEFDKMSDVDRTAIHEVMEQGRVTIAKAGIHARLNARTAVLAAANPVYGRYDSSKTPMENIGLQDSLLSRFDLLFIMRDIADEETDGIVAEHVLRIHRYRKPNEQDGEPTPLFDSEQLLSTWDLQKDTSSKAPGEKPNTYEKYDPLLHGTHRMGSDKILSMDFMKKYIHIAKIVKPQLSDEACATICDDYTKLRMHDIHGDGKVRTQPITARTLETLIRLSTAYAKARMSRLVTKEDALNAVELLKYALFEKVTKEDKKRRRNDDGGYGDGDDGGDDGGDDDDDETMDQGVVEDGNTEDSVKALSGKEPTASSEGPRKSKRSRTENGDQVECNYEGGKTEETLTTLRLLRKKSKGGEGGAATIQQQDSEEPGTEEMDFTPVTPAATISNDRFTVFRTQLSILFQLERSDQLQLQTVKEYMERRDFEKGEVHAGMKRMEEEGKVQIEEGLVFII